MYSFDLFKTLAILTIVGLVIVLISLVDFSNTASWDEITFQLEQPFEAKNWHFVALMVGVYLSGGSGK